MAIFSSINISSTALTAEKTRIDIIAKNMANANTTRTTGGTPYRRQMVVFEESKSDPFSKYLDKHINKINGQGVKISKIVEDESPFKLVYEPGHPDADENGYVRMPNVDIMKEMVDLISAQRSYDANITAINTSKSMLMKALEIGRR
ncbi:MAG: flagellar basal body rod protein FlgC [Tissierellia bacterium]|nr:flagellar basal body rod protein FlgC [Tissierellia bacterium]